MSVSTEVESFKHKGLTVRIEYDDNPDNPRTWDNLGTMVCFHKRYNIGDEHEYRTEDYAGWDAMEAAIKQRANVAVILPVYLYDHSTQALSTRSWIGRAQHAEWDSGKVGFIFVSQEKALAEYGGRNITAKKRERIVKCLNSEVDTLSDFMQGMVYGFVVEDAEGEHLDSCWGFYGLDYCRSEARAAAKSHATPAKKAGKE